jgi:hypothetical protein
MLRYSQSILSQRLLSGYLLVNCLQIALYFDAIYWLRRELSHNRDLGCWKSRFSKKQGKAKLPLFSAFPVAYSRIKPSSGWHGTYNTADILIMLQFKMMSNISGCTSTGDLPGANRYYPNGNIWEWCSPKRIGYSDPSQNSPHKAILQPF